MKKADKKLLDASLNKALAPPKPRQNLDALLDEYDDEQRSPASLEERKVKTLGIPATIPSSIPLSIPSRQFTKREAKRNEEPDETVPQQTAPLDATHTGSEKSVYSIMYRETVSKGITERHFGPAELMKKTGIRSRNTVHKALYGLVEKLSIEVVTETKGNPIGPRYRVYKPLEIERRRKGEGIRIDPQTKKIVERGGVPTGIPESIPSTIPKNWDTTIPENGIPTIPNIGTLYKKKESSSVESDAALPSSSNPLTKTDDEAFAGLVETLKQITTELTGKSTTAPEAPKWKEFAEVLVAELRIAAGRTTISSVPAFMAEHLRRRLWKMDKKQAAREGKELPDQAAPAAQKSPVECKDCNGSGWWYPNGTEKGVAKCKHSNLKGEA